MYVGVHMTSRKTAPEEYSYYEMATDVCLAIGQRHDVQCDVKYFLSFYWSDTTYFNASRCLKFDVYEQKMSFCHYDVLYIIVSYMMTSVSIKTENNINAFIDPLRIYKIVCLRTAVDSVTVTNREAYKLICFVQERFFLNGPSRVLLVK